MKLKLLLSASLFYSINLLAQNSNENITYLDSLSNPTTEANYKYKQVISNYIPEQGYNVKTYYKSGQLKSEGTSSNNNRIIFIGTSKSYYENGQLETVLKNPGPDSPVKVFQWYENGQKKSETKGYFDKKDLNYVIRVIQAWDKDGNQLVKNGNGIYEEVIGNVNSKGPYKKSYKHGLWTGYDTENNFTFTETYEKGKLISGTSIDSYKNEYHYERLMEGVFPKKNNVLPFDLFLNNELPTFNPESKFYNLKSEVKITIDRNGKLTKVETIPDINKEIPEVISKIFELYGEWNPTKKRGIAYPLTFIVPKSRTFY